MFGGTVVKGEGKSKNFGFPTANLDFFDGKSEFDDGIYAVICFLEGERYAGALYIDSNSKKLEVHFLNYSGDDFYGKFLEVDVIRKVSDVKKGLDAKSLIKKIDSDVEKVREALFELDDF